MVTAASVDDLSPDEIANLSEAEMNALIAEATGGQSDESDNGDHDQNDGDQSQAASSATAKGQESTQDDDSAAAGILAKDGKSIIPIEVLQSTREKLTQTQGSLTATQQQLSTAEAELAELRAKVDKHSSLELDADSALSEEELQALEEEMPEVAAKIRKAQDIAAKAQAVIKRQQEQDEISEQNKVINVVQEAIDSVPKLAYLQATNPKLFDMAKREDAALRADPANKDLTLSERFAKAVAEVEKTIGTEIKLPNAKGGKKDIQIEDKTQITGLDDISGGDAPVNDEVLALASKSPTELAAMFDGMSEREIDNFLARATQAAA